MKVETDRLELVALNATQLRLLVDNLKGIEDELNIVYKGEPIEGHLLDIMRKQIEKVKDDEINYAFLSFWMIIRKHDRVVVGTASFKYPPGKEKEVEIGYGLGVDHRGNGYMTEAVRAMCSWALEMDTVDFIIAETYLDNNPSARVLERSGFIRNKVVDKSIWWILSQH